MQAIRLFAIAATCACASAALATDRAAAVETYAGIAAAFGDSLTAAKRLQMSVDALIAAPSADTVEFLLWGQDLNGFGPGAGQRQWTDLAADACTNGNCDRRADPLKVATDLLVADLDFMAGNWAEGGAAGLAVTADPDTGLQAMLTGMGSLGYGEQAGQRMKLGLMLNDPEEEHDCFSGNTFNSHYYNGLGIRNICLGQYLGIDGTLILGPSPADLVAEADPGLDRAMRADLDDTMARPGRIKTAGEAGFAHDMMLQAGNARGEALIMGAVDALVHQTRGIEHVVTALGLNGVTVEGSDSLDNPAAVFQ